MERKQAVSSDFSLSLHAVLTESAIQRAEAVRDGNSNSTDRLPVIAIGVAERKQEINALFYFI